MVLNLWTRQYRYHFALNPLASASSSQSLLHYGEDTSGPHPSHREGWRGDHSDAKFRSGRCWAAVVWMPLKTRAGREESSRERNSKRNSLASYAQSSDLYECAALVRASQHAPTEIQGWRRGVGLGGTGRQECRYKWASFDVWRLARARFLRFLEGGVEERNYAYVVGATVEPPLRAVPRRMRR